MLNLVHLKRTFGPLTAVDDVSLEVGSGEVLGFLGPNGAGKSTSMRMAAGFLAPSAGTAVLGGHDIRTQRVEAQRLLGYLPEGAPAYPDMTPHAFLHFVGRVRGMDRAARRRRIDEVCERVRLRTVMGQTIETLSKGYRRRVGLAQALLHDPPILILDEPTDGLDPNQKHEVRTLIRELGERKAIVISTHILEEVDPICTRVAVIASGRLVLDGSPDEMRSHSPSGSLDEAFRSLTTSTAGRAALTPAAESAVAS